MKRYLIVKTSSLGDIVQAFAAAYYLKKQGASIDWVVEKRFETLVEACPFVDNVLTVDTKKWRKKPFCKSVWSEIRTFTESLKSQEYDAVFDLQGNLKSGLIDYFANSKYKVGFSKASVPEKINTFFTNFYVEVTPGNVRDDMLSLVKSYFNDKKPFSMPEITLKTTHEEQQKIEEILTHTSLQGKKRFCIAPFSTWKNKELALEELIFFLKKIQKEFSLSFLFLHGSEEERLKAVQLASHFQGNAVVVERLPASSLQALICRLDGMIGSDSFPLHLAGTTKTPTFSFFGPSLAARYAPQGSEKAFFQGICPYGVRFEKRCPSLRTCKTGACLKALKGGTLAARFKVWWQAIS